MEEQLNLLIKAVENLKQEPNLFKEYIFPIVSAFLSAIFGALIAYLTLKRQESLKLEKDKIDTANQWTLDIQKARSCLISIKQNYYRDLGDVPTQRLGATPTIFLKTEPIPENYHSLGFIVPSANKKNSDKQKWAQISRIDTLVSNYNLLLNMWSKRNEINEQFKRSLMATYGNRAFHSLSLDDAVRAFGHAGMVALLDLNERCIKLTDDLIIEANDFLENFPAVAKKKINLKRVEGYSQLLTYSHDNNEKFLEMLAPIPQPDYSTVTELFGESADVLRERHSTGYEQS